MSGSASPGFKLSAAYDFGFGSARRSKIESVSMPSGALCEKPKEASSTRKQLSSGPLALALICATGTLVGQPSLVEERTRRERRARGKLREVLGVKMRPVRACGPHCITYHHVAEGYTYFIVSIASPVAQESSTQVC